MISNLSKCSLGEVKGWRNHYCPSSVTGDCASDTWWKSVHNIPHEKTLASTGATNPDQPTPGCIWPVQMLYICTEAVSEAKSEAKKCHHRKHGICGDAPLPRSLRPVSFFATLGICTDMLYKSRSCSLWCQC